MSDFFERLFGDRDDHHHEKNHDRRRYGHHGEKHHNEEHDHRRNDYYNDYPPYQNDRYNDFQNNSRGIVCQKCGISNSATAKFCNECGNNLQSIAICPNCKAPIKNGAKFCQECGTKIG
ncbi:zinc ribbon domain-containing protein [Sporolactobacillus spathodeae]|uniref:Ribosomal protein L40E n=1 Tax=Sporolactobacillus spathodeae TaxID=1465502 RepID=A0ABS2Q841_9BACL|nr:zinc ribbon domain-containing protein [Sporolactobacillus spathodeae]MBM7657963.1 ribosomal protein L40E [Sporolactobacillus spathodeae]